MLPHPTDLGAEYRYMIDEMRRPDRRGGLIEPLHVLMGPGPGGLDVVERVDDALIASGRPVSPSQQTMHASATPRLFT